MTTTFKNFVLNESVSDAGLFKAVFVIGIPGSGKSYTVRKLSGRIAPRIVNTDRAVEYLSRKFNRPVNKDTWPSFKDTAYRITANALTGYLDGALPLIVDGTSNNVPNILARVKILESIGYDVGMVYVDASLEVSIERARRRAEQIGRHVDEEFIKKVHDVSEKNRRLLKPNFSFYKEIINNDSESAISNGVLVNAFKKVQAFYNSEIQNPIGKRIKERMIAEKIHNLIPAIVSKEVLTNKIDGWY